MYTSQHRLLYEAINTLLLVSGIPQTTNIFIRNPSILVFTNQTHSTSISSAQEDPKSVLLVTSTWRRKYSALKVVVALLEFLTMSMKTKTEHLFRCAFEVFVPNPLSRLLHVFMIAFDRLEFRCLSVFFGEPSWNSLAGTDYSKFGNTI
jgi:hypothetical protein